MNGAVIASVGQASRHAVHVPHAPGLGESGGRSKPVSSSASCREGPWVGEITIALLARKPMPDRTARARSSTGTASVPPFIEP